MNRLHLLSLCILLLTTLALPAPAQAPKKMTSAEIYEAIQRLNVLASVLYVAAHPDDENTNFISYLSNERHYDARYLSLTRGDGGQNLIGTEIRELLGVLRTEELLAARRIDGGKQFFSRANDFGYSKNPEETLRLWDKQEVLSDVVWAIRKFQPDVVINRFSHTTERPNHGQHTASAQLSLEAFDLAGDKNAFPEQLAYTSVWKPKRQFLNTSWWFYGSQEAFDKIDKSNLTSLDIGAYYPALGKSNREIAAESRSQHRCQAMGTMGERGSSVEYFELLKGDKPQSDILDGINTTWTRVEGGAPIGKILMEVQQNYNFVNPAASVPKLVQAYQLIHSLPDSYWKDVKLSEIREVIRACLGLYIEAIAADYSATPGETLTINLEAINRSNQEVSLKAIHFLPDGRDSILNLALPFNKDFKFKMGLKIPQQTAYTSPYWLIEPWSQGMYQVKDQQLRGLPETPRALQVDFELSINGAEINIPVDIAYKWEESARGEVYRPFEITPPVFANFAEKSFMFPNTEAKTIEVKLKAGRADVSGKATLQTPAGWRVEPEAIDFQLQQKGEEKTVSFTVYPPNQSSDAQLRAVATVDGKPYSKEVISIKYDHIPIQTILLEATARIVRFDLQKSGIRVGYIMGAGDEIPNCLQQVGYEVTQLEEKDIATERLRSFDAIVMGVRAYNTREWLKFAQPKLLEYVQNGGVMLVQYNTSYDLYLNDLAPYPMKISRDRVTVEEAEVRLLKPDHPVLTMPNKITAADFEGWVQERGLYFPGEWDKSHFDTILSCNDPGETPKDGGLLVASYGKGFYIYTGYSWFRELPAGVPGAYRLFANLLSLKRP